MKMENDESYYTKWEVIKFKPVNVFVWEIEGKKFKCWFDPYDIFSSHRTLNMEELPNEDE